jgi:rod shape-determining protein MreD
MIAPRLQFGTAFKKRINRAPSPAVALALPWLSIALASFLPTLPLIASAPVMPPLGFLVLLAWRQVRPGVLPVWAGLPLGLVDDLYSGQPLGSAILLWSLAMLAFDAIEAKFPWRSFLLDWAVAAALAVAYLLLAAIFANLAGGATPLVSLVPQLLATVLLYPLVGRMVAVIDRLRLVRIRTVG